MTPHGKITGHPRTISRVSVAHEMVDRRGAAQTALVSVGAAIVLIAIKLVAGIVSGSLALISEALHSGTDLIAGVLAFLALRVAGRPADSEHPYGHGKAEHLSAILEGAILVGASVFIVAEAVLRLVNGSGPITTSWWIYAVLGLVIVIDTLRTISSHRGAQKHNSAALAAGAVHFASDLAGTLAVTVGLLLVDAGYAWGDSVAAIAVAALVLTAAGRLMWGNAGILLDKAPVTDLARAEEALAGLAPGVETRRLRLRAAGGHHFADVVVAVAPESALGQAHDAADAVEAALLAEIPGIDVTVHVEPATARSTYERVLVAAQAVPGVREVHNVRLVQVAGQTEASLHLKLPGDTPLADAHDAADRVEAAVRARAPEVAAVRTHIEPLTEPSAGKPSSSAQLAATVRAAVEEGASGSVTELRMVEVEGGLVAYVTVALPGALPLADAHARAAQARRRAREAAPDIRDVFVHTESA